MRTMRRVVLGALLCAPALRPSPATAAPLPPEFRNWFVPVPSTPVNDFTIIFKGNVLADIPAQDPTQTLTNPFAFGGASTITTSLDTNGNTDVVFSGATIAPGTTFPYPNGEPHFGLNDGSPISGGLQVLSMSWSFGTTQLGGLPAPTFFFTPLATGTNFQFMTFFAQVGGIGEWFEAPFTAGQPPQITIANTTTTPFTLFDAGIDPTFGQIPLDQLNFNSLPPPGQPGSPFIPLPNLDGTTLAPGQVVTVSTPEPRGVVSFGVGMLGLAGYLAYRRGLGPKGRRRAVA